MSQIPPQIPPQVPPQTPTQTPPDPGTEKTAYLVYLLFLIGLVVPLVTLAGVIVAYVYRSDAPPWVETHFRFQIRTFWIGLLAAVIAVATIWIAIGFLLGLALYVWWIVRCVTGLRYINRNEPHPRPESWWFA